MECEVLLLTQTICRIVVSYAFLDPGMQMYCFYYYYYYLLFSFFRSLPLLKLRKRQRSQNRHFESQPLLNPLRNAIYYIYTVYVAAEETLTLIDFVISIIFNLHF